MAWQLLSPPKADSPGNTLKRTLSYSSRFNYPLSLREVWLWQIGSSFPEKLLSRWPFITGGFYHLKGAEKLVSLRKTRAGYSRSKWIIAGKYSRLLSRIPTISAIFITGSLAMNNSPRYDDIDFLIVSRKHTVWITRLLVVLLLAFDNSRRQPYLLVHSSPGVSDKICDNLYLDTDHLFIPSGGNELYLAHEILQAKCVFDRGGIHHRFLTENVWTESYLPIAYSEITKNCQPAGNPPAAGLLIDIILFAVNWTLFMVQYLYMRPHLTGEKISLGYAFFHPKSGQPVL